MSDSPAQKLRQHLKSIDRPTVIISSVAIAGLVAIAGGGAYFSPYLALNNMKSAAVNRNAEALAQEIDFSSLRGSIKENIKAQVIKQVAGSKSPDAPKLSPELVTKVDRMVGPMVDKIVTPEGIDQLMQEKVPGAKIDLSNLEKDIAKSDVKMGYESLNRFVVHITDKVDRAKDVSLILKRDGIAWKLSGVDISKV
jgi:Protein of unknown function (DUF2939)